MSHRWPAWTMPGRNVLVTFTLAIVLMSGYQLACHSTLDMIASLRPISPTPHDPADSHRALMSGSTSAASSWTAGIGLPLGLLMMLLAMVAAIWLKPDYDIYGLLHGPAVLRRARPAARKKTSRSVPCQGFVILNLLFLAMRILLHRRPGRHGPSCNACRSWPCRSAMRVDPRTKPSGLPSNMPFMCFIRCISLILLMLDSHIISGQASEFSAGRYLLKLFLELAVL